MDNSQNLNYVIGQNLKRLRKERKLTQKELADKLNEKGRKTWNVSISQYESGKTAISYDLLVDLAAILGCSVGDITGRYDTVTPAMQMAKALRSAADILENQKSASP